jgi:prolipoprotein diacylglyceryltransferase
VVALEPVGSVPLIHKGIRIRHSRADFPDTIIFWPMGGRARILAEIAATGFAPQAPAEKAVDGRGFPVRWQAIAVLLAVWNALLLIDFGLIARVPNKPGPLTALALLIVFGLATGVKVSARLQGLLMREGRSLGEIRPFVSFLQLITGLMLLGAVLMLVLGI